MYKEILICIVIIVLVVSGDTITQNYTKKNVKMITQALEELAVTLEQENQEMAIKQVENVNHQLEKMHNIMAYYMEHDELEKLETDFITCKSFIQSQSYNDADSELKKTIFVLNHIKDKYSFNLENIF